MLADQEIILREPVAEDGARLHRLVASCPPLDPNSMYCNLLQCSHFSQTAVAAEAADELIGFVSGYLLPKSNHTLFIWQVAVSEKARGKGLAGKMISHILERSSCQHVTHIETSITGANEASWGLFNSVAKHLNTQLNRSVMFDRKKHFNDEHDTEYLATIGPFSTGPV